MSITQKNFGMNACGRMLAILLAFAPAAVAQFNITNISPAHGSTNVAANAVLAITFSAPLDTSFRFDATGLPINIELYPDSDTAFVPPSRASVSYSSDLRTIRLADLNLQANTRFVLLVIGARSSTSVPLARPATVTFSTGASLPNASVSGTVSYTGGAGGAVVGVFGALNDGTPVSFAIAADNGAYTVPFLPSGSYFVLSIKDVNQDGEINPSKVDPIGGYDPDANKLVNQFSLAAGSSLTGINLTLRNAAPKTARALFSPVIENIAKTVQNDAQLVALAAANLSTAGQSTFWNFVFYSAALKRNFSFAGSDAIVFPFFDSEDNADTLAAPLPTNWIDSEVALDTAQARVGRDFLQKYPNAEINGFAGEFEFGGGANPEPAPKFHFGLWPRVQARSLHKARAQQQTAWLISYFDAASDRNAFIALDVQTGKTLFIFRLTTARPNLAVAQAAALQWTSDAQLVLLSAPRGGFSPLDGASPAWVFQYYSARKDSTRQFLILFGALAEQQNVSNNFKRPLPPGWLDSDKTAPVAENLGGTNFRRMNPGAQAEAYLGYVKPVAPNRLVWGFRYISIGPQPAELVIYVDAFTGVRVAEKAGAPENFVLREAYPNPLTNGQIAQWSLHAPVAIEARAEIYNLLGQHVATILRQNVPAGESIFAWDGRHANGLPAASGVYFLRIAYREANTEWQVMTQRLLLRK